MDWRGDYWRYHYASYLGGGGLDSATCIIVDADFVASVTGATASSDFPVTPDAPQGTFAGGPFLGDAFMVQFSTDGSTLLFDFRTLAKVRSTRRYGYSWEVP